MAPSPPPDIKRGMWRIGEGVRTDQTPHSSIQFPASALTHRKSHERGRGTIGGRGGGRLPLHVSSLIAEGQTECWGLGGDRRREMWWEGNKRVQPTSEMSRHIFVASPDESFKKNSRHRVMRRIFVFALMTWWRESLRGCPALHLESK